MISTLTVTNHQDESLTIELTSPEESGFIVLGVDGLGPVKADIALTERAAVDGSLYNSARATPRNVVLRLRFFPGGDIEALRQKSYRYFPLKKEITLQIDTEYRTSKGTCFVEANEPDIFSKEEGCAITMVFPESYLYDYFQQLTVFSSQVNLFEFPWSNESVVSPLLEFSELIIESTRSVLYSGDAPVGILIHIHANGPANDVTIIDTVTLEQIAIDSAKLIATVGSDIIAGDDIWISTVQGNKYAMLIRASTEYNILNCLGTSPAWFQLERGDNVFAYTADSGLGNLEFEIYNETAYEGV